MKGCTEGTAGRVFDALPVHGTDTCASTDCRRDDRVPLFSSPMRQLQKIPHTGILLGLFFNKTM